MAYQPVLNPQPVTDSAAESSLSSIDTKLTSQSTAVNQATEIASLSSIDGKLTSQATAANQATEIVSLASIDGKTPALVTGRTPVDGSGVTQPISAASLPLPTGAATTSAAQTTGNASLSSIDGKLGILNPHGNMVTSVQKSLVYERGWTLAADKAAFITAYPQWTVTTDIVDSNVYTNASKQIVVESGTGIGKIKLLHTTPLKGDLAAKVLMMASQRIANQSIQFGLENALDTNAAYVLLDGIVVTSMKGKTVSDSLLVTTATLTSTTSAALANYGVYNSDSAIVYSNSATAAQLIALSNQSDNLIDPNETYYLVFEIVNAAAVVNTIVTIGNIIAEDITNYHVSTSIAPRSSATVLGTGAPVLIQNGTLTIAGAVTGVVGTLGAQTSQIVPVIVADQVSAAITTTATSAAITPGYGASYIISVPVTAVTGTNPTMDLSIEESDNTATNYRKIYDFPRITATGVYRSPPLRLTGNRLRYVWTIGGTTPSFTRSLNRLQTPHQVTSIRQLVNRTIVLTTVNSVTPSLETNLLTNFQMTINIGAATVEPILILEGSDDNVNFYPITTTVTAIASSTVSIVVTDFPCNFVRGRVSTAGTTVTAGYITIRGY